MLNNQQLYLVNHFALVARRSGLHLPDLKLLLKDEARLRSEVETALTLTQWPAVTDAARKVAAAFGWPLAPPESPGRQARAPAAPAAAPMTADERARAKAALLAVAGPIAGFIAEQIGDAAPLRLDEFVDQAAALAQLSDDRRRALRTACGLPG